MNSVSRAATQDYAALVAGLTKGRTPFVEQTDEFFDSLNLQCGSCHVLQNLGLSDNGSCGACGGKLVKHCLD